MSTLQQLKAGLNDAWESFTEGWQRLYRHAAGAITRFTPNSETEAVAASGYSKDLSVRSAGWGVLTAEVSDDDDRVVVRLEVPGLEREDIDLQVHEDYLVVSGEKRIESEHKAGRFHVTECAYGCFQRAIPLPMAVDADKASASYKQGVLKVELPKSSASRRKSIKVVAT